MSGKLGKHCRCEVCGKEVFSTKPGEEKPACCDQKTKTHEPKTIPSSDWWFLSNIRVIRFVRDTFGETAKNTSKKFLS
jgi:hypothetical protein